MTSTPQQPQQEKPTVRTTGTRRAEIARVALDLAAEMGPAAVSTGMIAARLGISQPALYKHFRNKRDIWAGIGEEIATRITANLSRAQAEEHAPLARLRRQVLDHLRLIAEIPALPDIMLLRGHDDSLAPLRERVLEAMSEFHARLAEAAREAHGTGLFAPDVDPEDAASLVMGLIQNLVLRMALSGRPGDMTGDGERMLELLMRAFLTPQPAAAAPPVATRGGDAP